MKTRIFQLALLIGGLLLNASCSNESDSTFGGDEDLKAQTSSLTVTISGEDGSEIGKVETRAIGSPTLAEENKIFNYLVYVFYSNGSLEKVDTIPSGTLTTNITGLTSGAKKVAVLANVPSGYGPVTNYSDLDTAMFNLDTQEPAQLATTGLAMSGEATITLVAGSANPLTVNVSRVVAKIKLGGITINAAPGHDPAKFELVAVHIMKARASANMGRPTIKTGSAFYGGMAGVVSTVSKTYLSESITSGNENCYFYVFPNDNTSDNATLFTIEAKYDNATTYFPICINEKVVTAGDGTGEYIKRNTAHTINITLKKLGGGTVDPELPVDPTDLDVTIVPEDWIIIPDQDVEW